MPLGAVGIGLKVAPSSAQTKRFAYSGKHPPGFNPGGWKDPRGL